MMPSEEEIARVRQECALMGVEAYHADAHVDEEEEGEQGKEAKGDTTAVGKSCLQLLLLGFFYRYPNRNLHNG